MKKLVIYDMDGTLIDSMGYWAQAEKEIFSSVGVTLTPEDTAKTAAMSTTEVTDFWFRKHPWTEESKATIEQSVINHVINNIQRKATPLPGVIESLNLFKSLHFQIALATNSPEAITKVVVKSLGISDYFDFSASVEAVSSPKPAPDIYEHVLKAMSVKAEEAIAIEDSVGGLTAAKSAGIDTILVNQDEQISQDVKANYHLSSLDQLNLRVIEQIK